jgi:hypothetical protein
MCKEVVIRKVNFLRGIIRKPPGGPISGLRLKFWISQKYNRMLMSP